VELVGCVEQLLLDDGLGLFAVQAVDVDFESLVKLFIKLIEDLPGDVPADFFFEVLLILRFISIQ